jgi:Protein of unknown function (DUF642)
MQKHSAANYVSVFLSIASSFLGMVYVDCAHAQNVINPDFELPSVAQEPNGFIQSPPTGPDVGWEFGSVAGQGNSGVQRNNSVWGAPTAPTGNQTGYIQNLGSISQTINFTSASDYTLSFELAARLFSVPPDAKGQIQVSIDGNALEKMTPANPSSFSQITIPFKIDASGDHTLSFTGVGISGNGTLSSDEDTSAFIDTVSITGR